MAPITLPGAGRLGVACPVCRGGTLLIEIFDNPVRVRFSAVTWEGHRIGDRCSRGCTASAILAELA